MQNKTKGRIHRAEKRQTARLRAQNESLRQLREPRRLWDLIRYCRGQLYKDRLIDGEEYAILMSDNEAVDRLHTYDALIAKLLMAEMEIAKLKKDRDKNEQT